MLQIGSVANYIQICNSLTGTKLKDVDPHTDSSATTASVDDPLAARIERIRRNQTHKSHAYSIGM
jgi:hypothetical protein